jgi:nitrite reductase/ring-hydroxylating ferredoxin subunit
VDTTAFQAGSQDWVDAIALDDVQEGQLSVADVGGVPVLVTRTTDQTLVAYADRCTHRGGPLHEGTLVDGCVRCPWHDSEFRLDDGAVVRGPATRPQPAYESRVVGDRVELRRSSEPRSLRTDSAGA